MESCPSRVSLVACVILLLVTTATGAQESVYGPAVPNGSAFVRVANVDPDQPLSIVDVGSLRFRDVAPSTVTAYRPVEPGIYLVGRRGAQSEFIPAEDRYYTLLMRPETAPRILSDETHRDPARTQLVLYNAGDRVVSLHAPAEQAVVIEPVDPGGSGVRVVNAIEVSLAIVTAGAPVLERRLSLGRGESWSFFATPAGGFIAPAVVAPN